MRRQLQQITYLFLFQIIKLSVADPIGACPEIDGEYVTLLPHGSDCTKFYICNGGNAVVAECQSGLLFNPNLLVCDYPESAGCVEVSSGNESNSDNGSEEESVAGGAELDDDEEEEKSQSNGGGTQVVGECPDVDGEYVSLLPHESDCTKFYICSEGTPVIAECPSGLLFNPNLLVCDYPESAGCGGVSSGNENNSDNGNEEQAVAGGAEEDDEEEEEETQSNGGGSQVVRECPEVDGEYVSLLPHESDCTKFYICNEGTPVIAECPSGLLFNPNLLVCDYPESAGCGGVSSGNESNSDNDSEEESVAGGAEEDDEEEEEETQSNGAGSQVVGECPEVDGEYVTLLPHESDCTKFYICNGGTPVVAECQSGLLFNPNLLVCDYPESAGCGGVSPGNENNSDNGSEEEAVAGGAEDDEEEEETQTNGGGSQVVGECPDVDGEYVSLLPHESDCTKFYICNEGTPVIAECPSGLLFNPNLLVCDYPESAGCGGVSSGNESNSDNGSEEESVAGGAEEEDDEEEEESQSNGGGSQVVGECPDVDGEYVSLLPHESDCTKFYICNEGTPVIAECPSGLLFNPNLLVCDYPESAGCGEVSSGNESNSDNGSEEESVAGGAEEDDDEEEESQSNGGGSQVVGECPEVDGEYVTLLPHESDCTKFYICNEGTPVIAECPSGLLFNPNLLVCDYPESAGCGEVSSGNESNSDNGSEEEAVPGGAEEDDEEEEESQGNGGGSQVVGECPEVDGEYVTLLPHESDCTKFYICNGGTPVVAECQSGLLFNPNLLVCDYPESAGCGGVSPGDENNSDNGSEEEAVAGGAEEDDEEEEEETQSNGGGSQVVGECPDVDGEYVTLLPHKSDCTKFYICNGGTPVVAECQSGLLFNPNLLVCDYPESAGCGEVSSGNENNNGNGIEEEEVAGGSEEVEQEEESQNNSGGSQVVGECPDVDGEYVSLLPHESDCTKFYICNEGTPVIAECPSGLLFNPNLLVCDYPESAGCGEVSSGNESNSDNGSEEEAIAGGAEEDDEEEEESQSNGGGSQVVGECPDVDGEYVSLLPHESDCTKFYICNEGTPVIAECPSGLLFNPNLLVCDYPESAGCGEVSSGNESNSDNGSEEEAIAGGAEEDDEEEEESQSNGGGSQVVGECPDVDGEYVSLLPHESDCTKFYICNEGTPVIAECPSGLLFNPNLLVCDYPESAGCV